jgi:hypothetical protein
MNALSCIQLFRLNTRRSRTRQRPLLALSTKRFCLTSLASALSGMLVMSSANAEEVRANMNQLLEPFRSIQPYIAAQERFMDPDASNEIADLIDDLRKNFHKLESVPSKYHKLPGFDENLQAVSDLLDDSSRRFAEGKRSYAWWRLRKLPSDCFTCHATYKVSSHYSNPAVVDESLDPLNKGRFLLATRQFAEAQGEFLKALQDPRNTIYYNEALRSLLLIATRIDKNPSEGIATLERALQTTRLPEDDAREVTQWLKELRSWAHEKPSASKNSVAFAEQLITGGAVSSPMRPQNDVSLLRGTAILHQLLEQGALKKEVRPQALYLLGFAYTKLPLFFSESWAEMYLERCINEFPGSPNAKRAFSAYREHIVDDYTGTAGTEIPDEVQLHLQELRKKAFGEPDFKGVVQGPTRGALKQSA